MTLVEKIEQLRNSPINREFETAIKQQGAFYEKMKQEGYIKKQQYNIPLTIRLDPEKKSTSFLVR